jgi:hypothetical protein
MIIVPQIKIEKVLETLIKFVVDDYNNKIFATLETEAWLYRVFHGLKVREFDYYIQSIEMLVNRGENSPRRLEIRRDFDPERATLPTIFINTPSETQQGENTVGMGLGSTTEFFNNNDGTQTETYSRHFKGIYELMITSNNKDEAELLYRFLQAVFIAAADTLSFTFAGTFEWSGKQLMSNPELIETPLSIRVLTITIYNEIRVPRLMTSSYGDDVEFTGTPLDPDAIPSP